MTTPYDVHLEWGVRRPDGDVVPMHSEDIARGFAAGLADRGFTVVTRVVAHIPWTADFAAAVADVEWLKVAVRCGETP